MRVQQRLQLELWARQHAFGDTTSSHENWPGEWRLERHGMIPIRHGDYSIGLSAIFAAVNGLRLVTAGHCKLNRSEEQSLISHAWCWRTDRERVSPDRGLRKHQWIRMVEALCAFFGRTHGQHIVVLQPWRDQRPAQDDFFVSLEKMIVAQHVVLSLFAGGRYTVVRGYTCESLLLFDSGAKQRLRRRCIDLSGTGALALHRLVAASTLVLRRSF